MKTPNFHVQIALVGGQPTPVYQGIVHMQPNQVMLICSKASRKVAEDISKQLPSYEEKDVMIYEVSDTDVEAMYETIEIIAQSIPKRITVSLNVSGGLKLWSLIFNTVFRRRRRSCHTFCIGQDGTFFDLKERKTKGKVAFDMDAQFRILGHKLDEYIPFGDYTNADFRVLDRVRKLGFGGRTHEPLRELTQKFCNGYRDKYKNSLYVEDYEVSIGKNSLKWDAKSRSFDCQIAEYHYRLSSEHVENILLNTGWFELHVACLIAQIYGKENIRMNCVFRNVKHSPKNEIDIVVNTGRKLVFVECKTQVANTTDIDKFRSAVLNYGGLGSKPLFVTNSQMILEGQEKCNDHRIKTFYTNNAIYQHDEQATVLALKEVMENLEKSWNV